MKEEQEVEELRDRVACFEHRAHTQREFYNSLARHLKDTRVSQVRVDYTVLDPDEIVHAICKRLKALHRVDEIGPYRRAARAGNYRDLLEISGQISMTCGIIFDPENPGDLEGS